jgi:hypothetical protein
MSDDVAVVRQPNLAAACSPLIMPLHPRTRSHHASPAPGFYNSRRITFFSRENTQEKQYLLFGW